MSAVKKTAKASLYLFSLFVLLVIGGAVYLYVNMNSLGKQLVEQAASNALGVPVYVGAMDINLEETKVVVTDVKISNPQGYSRSDAITVSSITIDGESFSKELLNFSQISVDGTNINLEVGQEKTNLGDIKKNIASKQSSHGASSQGKKGSDIKVIVQKFSLTKAQLNPSVTLLGGDLAKITVPDIHLTGIGQKENGVLAEEAIAQIMDAVLQRINTAANGAGYLEGMSLEALNAIGVNTVDVFKKNLKQSYDKEVEGFKKGIDDIKGLFE